MQPFEIEERRSESSRANCTTCVVGVGVASGLVAGMGFAGLRLSGFASDIVTEQCQVHDVYFPYDVYKCPEQKEMCCADLADYTVTYQFKSSKFSGQVTSALSVEIFDAEFKRMAVCTEVAGKGDDFACYYPTFDTKQLVPLGEAGKVQVELQRVLCVRDQEAFADYIARDTTFTKAEVAFTLNHKRITVNDFKCSALRHECSMQACPAGGIYTGAAECTRLQGSEEREWLVTLTHPLIASRERQKQDGQEAYSGTQATEDFNNIVREMRTLVQGIKRRTMQDDIINDRCGK